MYVPLSPVAVPDLFRELALAADSVPLLKMGFKKIFASMNIVASLPDPTAISYGSRDGSKIIRRAIFRYSIACLAALAPDSATGSLCGNGQANEGGAA
ncbi:MAG: hypothetical protein Q8N94_00490 [Methanoregula sp.]|nr:hypothetical protein [Methanoregula sp.]